MVEYLLQCGANVHARDDGGLIPLHNACSFGHAEVVQLLLKHGADANSRDNWNYTPLHEAAIKGKIDVCIGKENQLFAEITLHRKRLGENWEAALRFSQNYRDCDADFFSETTEKKTERRVSVAKMKDKNCFDACSSVATWSGSKHQEHRWQDRLGFV